MQAEEEQTETLEQDEMNVLMDEIASHASHEVCRLAKGALPVADAAAGEEEDDEALDKIANREDCRPATGWVEERKATEVGWEMQEAGDDVEDELDQISSREACRPATGWVEERNATKVGRELEAGGDVDDDDDDEDNVALIDADAEGADKRGRIRFADEAQHDSWASPRPRTAAAVGDDDEEEARPWMGVYKIYNIGDSVKLAKMYRDSVQARVPGKDSESYQKCKGKPYSLFAPGKAIKLRD